MEQITVTDGRALDPELRRKKEIEQLKALISARCDKARATERYLHLFGHCKSAETMMMLRRHLHRTIESIWRMRADLMVLESPPRATGNV